MFKQFKRDLSGSVDEDETISAALNRQYNVSVTDSTIDISRIDKEQVEVFDDKVKQEITFFKGRIFGINWKV